MVRVGAAVAAAAIVGLIGRRVAGRGPTRLDTLVRRKVRSNNSRAAKVSALAVSLFGYPVVYVPAAVIAAEWLSRRGKRGAGPLAAAALGGWLVHRGIKLVVVRMRPPSQRGDSNAHRAYPSGHTAGTTSVALTGAYVLYREHVLPGAAAGTLGVAIPILMGMSRVFADEHWMTDVVSGWATGAAVAAIAAEAYHHSND